METSTAAGQSHNGSGLTWPAAVLVPITHVRLFAVRILSSMRMRCSIDFAVFLLILQ